MSPRTGRDGPGKQRTTQSPQPVDVKLMKLPTILSLSIAASLALAGVCGAQTAVVSTTTSDGTISEFSPDTIVIRSETSPEPVRYTYSKTTTYVDDAGAPVSLEVVKSGLPVTVHYVREGDRTVANRVIVHRRRTEAVVPEVTERRAVTTVPEAVERRTVTTVPVAPAVVEERSSSSTTTTTNRK